MKKYITLLIVCALLSASVTGCADVAEGWSETEVSREMEALYSEQITEIASPTEEGYFVVEGRLNEIDKSKLLLEADNGQIMYFKLAPETIVYAGRNKEIAAGQNIKVVFDGELSGEGIENVSVIAVALLEE